MRVLKLLVRVAFICNICFLLASTILWLPKPPEGDVVSTVIVLGYVMGLPLNAIVFGWMLSLVVAGRWQTVSVPGKWRPEGVPLGLMVVNFIIFCLQFISLIFHWK